MGEWKIDLSNLDDIAESVQDALDKLTFQAAEEWCEVASENAPQPGKSRGYAVGALRDSFYAIGRHENTYPEALNRVESNPLTRAVDRDQIELPAQITPFLARGKSAAVAGSVVSYATLINEGFFHAYARRFIIGQAFVETADNEVNEKFQASANVSLQKIMASHKKRGSISTARFIKIFSNR